MIFNKQDIQIAYEKHKEIVDKYFANNGKVYYILVDEVLHKLKFNVEKTDYHSLANEIFLDVICRYDGKQDFRRFLYTCLMNKFKSEMTSEHRLKRKVNKMALSLEEKVGKNEESLTILDSITDGQSIEKKIFDETTEGYSEKMRNYLKRLSILQKEVLRLISIGFSPSEILDELHINKKTYEDCYLAIHSYKNKKILM